MRTLLHPPLLVLALEASASRQELSGKLRLEQGQDRAQTREAMQERCRHAGEAGELDGLARIQLGGARAGQTLKKKSAMRRPLLAALLALPLIWQTARADAVSAVMETADVDAADVATAPDLPGVGPMTPDQLAAARFHMLETSVTETDDLELLAAECERRRFSGAKAARNVLRRIGARYGESLADARRVLSTPEAGRRYEQIQFGLVSRHLLRSEGPAAELRRDCRAAADKGETLHGHLLGRLGFVDLLAYRATPTAADDPAVRSERALVATHNALRSFEILVAECERQGFAEARPLRRTLDETRARYADGWRQAERASARSPWRREWQEEMEKEQARYRAEPPENVQEQCRAALGDGDGFDFVVQLMFGGQAAAATLPDRP